MTHRSLVRGVALLAVGALGLTLTGGCSRKQPFDHAVGLVVLQPGSDVKPTDAAASEEALADALLAALRADGHHPRLTWRITLPRSLDVAGAAALAPNALNLSTLARLLDAQQEGQPPDARADVVLVVAPSLTVDGKALEGVGLSPAGVAAGARVGVETGALGLPSAFVPMIVVSAGSLQGRSPTALQRWMRHELAHVAGAVHAGDGG